MPRIIHSTPRELGYVFPPEWATHAATWLSWPRPEGISFPNKYQPIPGNMADIIREIAPRERVEINVPSEQWAARVRQELSFHGCPLEHVYFHYIATNETWCRDHGPAFVTRQGTADPAAVVDWGFNAWGDKYDGYREDDLVPQRIAEELDLPVFSPQIIMEGGAIDVNGEGTLLTTESCLLNPNRNPELSREQIEQYLLDYYGQSQVIWLGEGIIGDDTDGHVDDVARFIDPRTVVLAFESDPRDPNHQPLADNLRRLELARDAAGQPFRVGKLPMPGVIEHDGQRLPASYANFYFVNGALLVPTYRSPNDRRALEILQELLPGRQVVGIDCVELIWGLGAIHCLTQQQPRW